MRIMPEYESFDALGLASLIKRQVVSPQDLLRVALARVTDLNPMLNAIVHTFTDAALSTLAVQNTQSIFYGVPFLLKDLFADYAGQPTSAGSHYAQGFIAQVDGELVKRFKSAGLMTFGKTNVPEFGLQCVTESRRFGPAKNPWDLTRSPGGSSGGSAAAVAAGVVPMAHGNDGGGSIRIPASFCGLFGFKPGRGMTPAGSPFTQNSLTVVEHVLTRSVRDSAAMLDILSQPQAGHFPYLNLLQAQVQGLQIGLIESPFFKSSVDRDVIEGLHTTGFVCQSLGHSVEPVSLWAPDETLALSYTQLTAHALSQGLKQFAREMNMPLHRADVELQTYILLEMGSRLSASDLAQAQAVIDQASQRMQAFFKDYDVLMTPTMGMLPPLLHSQDLKRWESAILSMIACLPNKPLLKQALIFGTRRMFSTIPFTPLFNMTGQPAMSVPLHMSREGLPVGIQFIADKQQEGLLLQLAAQLEGAKPWFYVRPQMGR